MPQSPAIRFAHTVQTLSAAARALGLEVPGFRSPPRLVGVQRSIKRGASGVTVAVVVKDRPWAAVQADLVEGVIAGNGLAPPVADRVRAELWAAIEPPESVPEPHPEARPGVGVRPAA